MNLPRFYIIWPLFNITQTADPGSASR